MKSNLLPTLSATAYQNILIQLSSQLRAFSLVNKEGQLLYSKDQGKKFLTTSRLVAYQIIQKYLQPKIKDLFVLNDPENGGFHFSQLIFVAALHENLFLIWNQENNLIDFKIPAIPLYEKGVKNDFVWKALIESHTHSAVLSDFFANEFLRLSRLHLQKKQVEILSLPRYQTTWLKATQEIFEMQLANKAYGSFETSYKHTGNEFIKLKLSAEEKQNIKMITLDFNSTSSATADFHAASHVVESGLIQNIIQFYQIENYCSQSVLDKIKIILPPKSVVSKAHPKGEWNSEIQSICSQLCEHNLLQLNSQKRKTISNFSLGDELQFELKSSQKNYVFQFSQENIDLTDFEQLIQTQQVDILQIQRLDQHILLHFKLKPKFKLQLKISSRTQSQSEDFYFKINKAAFQEREIELKAQEEIEIKWKP